MDDINSLASRYGVDFSDPSQGAGGKQPSPVPADDISTEDLGKRYGVTPESEAKYKETQKYKDLIASKMPEARKLAKELGTFGAIESGIKSVPVLGNVMTEIGVNVGAAMPESFGYATGKTFGERRQDMKAQMEAMDRATEEQSPFAAGAANLAASLFLPVPKGTGALPGASAAQKIGKGIETGAKVGMGYGAAEAASEKYLGTKPGHEDTSIIHGAEAGALLGGAAGGLFSGLGVGAQKLYDTGFAQKWINSEDHALSQVWKKYQEAQARNDPSFVSADKILEMNAKNQNTNLRLMDIGDDEFRSWITKEFEGRPQQAEKLIRIAKDRMENSQRNVKDFFNDMGEMDDTFEPFVAKQNAVNFAKNNEQDAFTLAKLPNNKVPWSRTWNNFVDDKYFQNAINNTEEKLKYVLKNKFKSPFELVEDDAGKQFYQLAKPDNATVHYMNQLRYELEAMASPMMKQASTKDVGNIVDSMAQDIVKSMSNPRSPSFNQPFADALNATRAFRGESNAWDFGQQFAANLNKPMKIGEMIQNAQKMTPLEKKYFTQSLLSLMGNRVFRKEGMELKEIDGFFNSNTKARKALEEALGKDRVDAMEVFLRSQYYQQKTARSFSQLGTGAPPESEIPMNAKAFVLGHFLPLMRAWATEFAHRQVNRKYAQKLADLLGSDKVADNLQAMRTFQTNTKLNNAFMTALEQAAVRSPALIGMTVGESVKNPGGFKSGGRVPFKSGGKVDKKMLKKAEKMGRNGDSILAHINRAEAEYLKRLGGSGKINPKTGLREFAGADESGSSVTSSNYGGSSSSSMDTSSGSGFDSSSWGGGGGGMLTSDSPSYSSSGGSDWKPSTGGGGGGGTNFGNTGNERLDNTFNFASKFGGSEIVSPLTGTRAGTQTGTFGGDMANLGIDVTQPTGLVAPSGGVAKPAETGVAATAGAGASMAAAKAAAEAGMRSTPSSGVLANEARLGPDQAMAPATGDWKQNPPSLAEPNQGPDWSKLYEPIVSGVKDIWNSIGAPDPSLQAKPIIELAPGEVGGYKGNLDPNKIQDRLMPDGTTQTTTGLVGQTSPSKPDFVGMYTGDQSGVVPTANDIRLGADANMAPTTGMMATDETVGSTPYPTSVVDPNSYQNYKLDTTAAYEAMLKAAGVTPAVKLGASFLGRSDEIPTQEQAMAKLGAALKASGSSFDPETGIIKGQDPASMAFLTGQERLPVDSVSGEPASINARDFLTVLNTPERSVPLPPTRDGSGVVPSQPEPTPAPDTAVAFSQPARPITPTPVTARSSEPVPSEEYSPREDTIPKTLVNNQAVPTISEFEGSDQGPFTPRGDGQSSSRPQVKYGQGGQRIYYVNGQWVDTGGNVYEGDVYDSAMQSQLGNANGGAIRFPQGRVGRATGGRIPDTDKVFKAAKKALDGHTKQYMNLPDDTIVHALRIAKEYH